MNRPIISNAHLILLAVILFSLAIRLPALFIPHIENDEVIYQTLAEKVSKNFNDYTLQGTPLISQLPKSAYDYPIFRHPPLFIWLLALIRRICGMKFEILLPIASGILTILVTYLIAKRLYSQEHGLISVLILSFCPILWFTSGKIWMETTFTLLTSLSFYILIIASDRKDWFWFGLAGLIFGLSLLTKHTSLGILPAAAYYIWRQKFPFKNLVIFGFCFFVAALLINLPWLYHYYKVMGTISYGNQYKVTQEYMDMFPFVKLVASRPFYYHFVALPFIYPVYLISWIGIFSKIRNRKDLSEVIWGLSFIIGFTSLGIIKYLGFNIRFLVPALPAFSILAADVIIRDKRIFYPLLIIFLSYGLLTGFLNIYIFQCADVFPISHFIPLLTHNR